MSYPTNLNIVGNTLNIVSGFTSFSVTFPAFATTNSVAFQGVLIGTAPTTISFPLNVTVCQVVYIKNQHSSQTLTVTWTPTGGAGAVVQTLQAGAVLLLVQPNATSGISALSLQASAANTPVDIFLAG